MYNWSNIAEDLKKHGVTLSADMRALITAGDSTVLIDLLSNLHTLQNKSSEETQTALATTLAQYLGTAEVSIPIEQPVVEKAPAPVLRMSEKNEKTSAFTKELMSSIERYLNVTGTDAV